MLFRFRTLTVLEKTSIHDKKNNHTIWLTGLFCNNRLFFLKRGRVNLLIMKVEKVRTETVLGCLIE